MNKYLASIAAAILAAAAVVEPWESKRNAAYQDHIGKWTVCYGHTGAEVVKGYTRTDAQCNALLKTDLAVAYATTEKCVPGVLPTSVRAAYVSFAFNVGPGGKGRKDGMCMLKSGAVPKHVKLLNAGDYPAACNALLNWSNAGGKFSQGVYNRRVAEVKLCKEDL